MSKLPAVLSFVALALAPLSGWADKQDLLDAAAKKFARAWSQHDPRGPYDDRTVQPLREASAACLEAIDAALAGGATAEDELVIPYDNGLKKLLQNVKTHSDKNGTTRTAPLGEAKKLCAELAIKPDVLLVERALYETDLSLGAMTKIVAKTAAEGKAPRDARSTADIAMSYVEKCRKAVADGQQKGLAPETPFELKNAGQVTLADASARVCEATAELAQQVVAADAAKAEAKIAPYREALKGEKLNVFLNLGLIAGGAYGKGGKTLRTPADFKRESAWFIVVSWEDARGKTRFTVRKYTFNKKNKMTGVTEKSGCCDWPATRFFR